MSTSSVLSAGVLTKPVRQNVNKEMAQAIKPWIPSGDQLDDPDLQYHIRYVTDGVEKMVPTSKDVWRKVTGPMPKPGRLPPGYDNKAYSNFVILIDRQTRHVVDVDILPKHDPRHGLVPAAREDKLNLVIKIHAKRGSLEVLEVPPKISDALIRRVMNELDLKDQVAIGDRYANCEVVALVGDQVSLQPPRSNEDSEED